LDSAAHAPQPEETVITHCAVLVAHTAGGGRTEKGRERGRGEGRGRIRGTEVMRRDKKGDKEGRKVGR
jgi:hypothetical protein